MDHGHGTREAAVNGGPRSSRTASARQAEAPYSLHPPPNLNANPNARGDGNISLTAGANPLAGADYGVAEHLGATSHHSDPFLGPWQRARRMAGVGGPASGQRPLEAGRSHPVDAFLDSDFTPEDVETLFNPLVNKALNSSNWLEAEDHAEAIDRFLDEADPGSDPVDRRGISHVAALYLEGPPPKPHRTLGMFYPWQAHDESIAFRRRLQRLCGSMMLENHLSASREGS